MAEKTGIAWTRSTFNPWIGCTKVSPGCDHCYAEALDRKRMSKTLGGGTKVVPIHHWGTGAPRHRTAASTWHHPHVWNDHAAWEQKTGRIVEGSEWKGKPGFWPVFCASLADVFDNEVPDQWRRDLFDLIEQTPNLTWLLLTKRIGNAIRMLPSNDWAASTRWNVWLGASVVNQKEADRDIPTLLDTPAANRFVSYEPALGPVDFSKWLMLADNVMHEHGDGDIVEQRNALSWIIVGGESAQGGATARPFALAWARDTVKQCKDTGVACFVKQLGSNIMPVDPSEWPEDLRVQEFPT